MERTDQVLAVGRVDPGLAADGTVDLRQKRRRHLHEAHAAAQDGSGKSGDVADHPTAQRHDEVAALHPAVQKPVQAPLQLPPALRRFAGRQGQCRRRDPVGVQRRLQRRQVEGGDPLLGDDRDARPVQQRRDLGAGPVQKPGPDPHLVGAVGQRHRDIGRGHGRRSTRPAAASRASTASRVASIDQSGCVRTTSGAAA